MPNSNISPPLDREAKRRPAVICHLECAGKTIYLRQNYRFGPEKIAMHLKRTRT